MATTLLLTTIADADWVFVDAEGNPVVNGYTLRRQVPYIDNRAADTLFVAQQAVTAVTNPVADGQTYTGKFANVKTESIEGTDPDNQREVIIRQTLVLVASVDNVTELAALTSEKMRSDEILNLFGLEEGERNVTGYKWRNVDPADQDNFIAISNANMVTNFASGSESYLSRRFVKEEDNTGTAYALFQIETWTNVKGASPDKIIDSRVEFGYDNYSPDTAAWVTSTAYTVGQQRMQSSKIYECLINHTSGTFLTDLAAGRWEIFGGSSRKTDGGTGIPTSSIQEVLSNEANEAGWAIDNIGVSERAAGESVLKKTQTLANLATDAIKAHVVVPTGNQPAARTMVFPNLTAYQCKLVIDDAVTHYANMAAATYYAEAASYQLKDIGRPVPTGSGLFNLTRTSWIPRYDGGSATDDWNNYVDSYTYVVPKWRNLGGTD